MDKDMMEPAARRCKSLYSDGEQREGFDINQTARKKQDPQPCHWSIKKNEIFSRITEWNPLLFQQVIMLTISGLKLYECMEEKNPL